MTITIADVRGALAAWLGAQHVAGVTKAFFAYPANPSRFPVLVVKRVGGGPDDNVPIDVARIQIDCWASGRNDGEAFTAAQAVVSALSGAPCGTMLRSDTRLLGAYGFTVVPAPDPSDGKARYVVTFTMQCQAV